MADGDEGGLTARERFAAAVLANPDLTRVSKGGLEGLARMAVDLADLVVWQLGQKPPPPPQGLAPANDP